MKLDGDALKVRMDILGTFIIDSILYEKWRRLRRLVGPWIWTPWSNHLS